MSTHFIRLNEGWNAEPNAPDPTVRTEGANLELVFLMNSFLYKQFAEDDVGHLRFKDCWRHRLGSTNDEGWYRGQCRFSELAPEWGNFYEIQGELLLDRLQQPMRVFSEPIVGSRHFLFYFRDNTFECDAKTWSLEVLSATGELRKKFNEA